MRIDGPKGLGSWLHGFFEGKFRGFLEGTASYAITASYVEGLEDISQSIEEEIAQVSGNLANTQEDLENLEQAVNDLTGSLDGTFDHLIVSGSSSISPKVQVHGNVRILGSLSQGDETVQASGDYSHAEGQDTQALGAYSHAEGKGTQALGAYSHAEGKSTRALGLASHAEGKDTVAIGLDSHAEGLGTIAASDFQTVIGRYNIPDSSEEYMFIIGNGTSNENRSNAFAVNWQGDIDWDGDIIIRKKVALRWNFANESLDIDFL